MSHKSFNVIRWPSLFGKQAAYFDCQSKISVKHRNISFVLIIWHLKGIVNIIDLPINGRHAIV